MRGKMSNQNKNQAESIQSISTTNEPFQTWIELRRLVDEYAIAADNFDTARYASLFTDDATFTATAQGGAAPFIAAHGREEISKVPDANRMFEQLFHAVHNHVVDVDGELATGITYCVARHVIRTEKGHEVLVLPLRYHDEYAKTTSGWKFRSRSCQCTWIERAPADFEAFSAWTTT
jgi:hypothetical protein